jgi:PII-like signaling protein
MNIAGATVFRGTEGFGDTAQVHRLHALTHDSPVMVTIVDTSDNIERIVPQLEEIVDSGLIVSSDVLVRRVNRGALGTEDEVPNATKQ